MSMEPLTSCSDTPLTFLIQGTKADTDTDFTRPRFTKASGFAFGERRNFEKKEDQEIAECPQYLTVGLWI